jgi:hypothetical protein
MGHMGPNWFPKVGLAEAAEAKGILAIYAPVVVDVAISSGAPHSSNSAPRQQALLSC